MKEGMALELWLDARGLDPELAAKFGWKQVKRNGGEPWVKIPYIRDHKEITAQYRSLDRKDFRFAPGSDVELWNCDILYDESLAHVPLTICEGACDALACVQAGFPKTVAVPGWSKSNTNAGDYEPFKRHEGAINKAERIIVVQHADEAGGALLRGIATFFLDAAIEYVTYPDECADANDVLEKLGSSALAQMLGTTKTLDPPGGHITGFSDLPPQSPRQVWKMDYAEFDKVMAWRSREISVLTGIPSGGKTTYATFCMHHLVRANGLRIGLCMFETDPDEIQTQLLRLKGITEYATEEESKAAILELDKHWRVVQRVDDTEVGIGMDWLKRIVVALARQGCKIVVIDPWNELEHQLLPGESMANYVNVALQSLRRWAERLDLHIMVIAHPMKMKDGKPPQGYDIADSAGWFNKVAMGWTVHPMTKDPWGEHVEVILWKVRSRQQTGTRPRTLRLVFDENMFCYRTATRLGECALTGP